MLITMVYDGHIQHVEMISIVMQEFLSLLSVCLGVFVPLPHLTCMCMIPSSAGSGAGLQKGIGCRVQPRAKERSILVGQLQPWPRRR